MKISLRVALVGVFVVSSTLILLAQAPPDLVKAARERDEAVDKADAATWDRLTADEFTLVNETGHLLTKAERLAEIRKSKPGPVGGGQCDQFKTYGNTAVRRCLEAGVRWLEVWVKSAQGWQEAAGQGTKAASK